MPYKRGDKVPIYYGDSPDPFTAEFVGLAHRSKSKYYEVKIATGPERVSWYIPESRFLHPEKLPKR